MTAQQEQQCYAYALVRTDLPLPAQLVQVGHACLQAGKQFLQPTEPCNLIVLAMVLQAHLQAAIDFVTFNGISYTAFTEPEHNLGITAACTQPLNLQQRRVFKHYKLWSI